MAKNLYIALYSSLPAANSSVAVIVQLHFHFYLPQPPFHSHYETLAIEHHSPLKHFKFSSPVSRSNNPPTSIFRPFPRSTIARSTDRRDLTKPPTILFDTIGGLPILQQGVGIARTKCLDDRRTYTHTSSTTNDDSQFYNYPFNTSSAINVLEAECE